MRGPTFILFCVLFGLKQNIYEAYIWSNNTIEGQRCLHKHKANIQSTKALCSKIRDSGFRPCRKADETSTKGWEPCQADSLELQAGWKELRNKRQVLMY